MKKNQIFNILIFLIGGVLFILIVLPILTILSNLLSTNIFSFFKDSELINSISMTIYASLIATIFGIFGGIPLGYILANYDFPLKKTVEAFIDIPVVIPHTAAGIALLTVFGRNAVLGKLFSFLGVKFVNEVPGIILAMIYVSVPFLINHVKEGFKKVDRELEAVSRTLGASKFTTFMKVSLPLVKGDIISGSIMMWARGISEFGAIVILAYNPKVISTLIYDRFESFGLRSSAPSVAFLLLLIITVFVVLRIITDRKK